MDPRLLPTLSPTDGLMVTMVRLAYIQRGLGGSRGEYSKPSCDVLSPAIAIGKSLKTNFASRVNIVSRGPYRHKGSFT